MVQVDCLCVSEARQGPEGDAARRELQLQVQCGSGEKVAN